MSDERSRYLLRTRLEQVLGTEEATTLMEHLPPTGWSNVTTTADVSALEERLGLRFEGLDRRFEQIDERFVQVDERFERLEERIDLRFGQFEGNLRAEFQRDLRVTTLAILAGNAALVAVMAALTNRF